MTEVLYDYPAYRLIKPVLRPVNHGYGDLLAHYLDGDVIALPRETRSHGTLYSFFTLGSVVGYAIKNCECPEASLKRAREFGHTIWWAGQNATSITAHMRAQRTHPLHEWGDTIRFHGRSFRIDPAPNGNVKLTLIEGNS